LLLFEAAAIVVDVVSVAIPPPGCGRWMGDIYRRWFGLVWLMDGSMGWAMRLMLLSME